MARNAFRDDLPIRTVFDARVVGGQEAADRYIGTNRTFSMTRIDNATYELYVHDGVTPGGFIFGTATNVLNLETRVAAIEAQMPDDFVASGALVGTDYVITLNNGTTVTTDISAAFDNINAVPGTYAVDGAGMVTLPLTDGNQVIVDTANLASDTELAAAIAALPPEEFLSPVVVSPAGVATFITNQGTPAGTIDIAAIATGLEDYLLQPTLVGTVVNFPMQQGVNYTLDLSSLNETITDNGDGSFTFDDGEGNTTIWRTDTDDQVVASADNTVTVTPTTNADGQVDYDLSIRAWIDANLLNNAGGPLIP
jgi:hypothetical protein